MVLESREGGFRIGISVSDPDSLNPDSDPGFFTNPDPDPYLGL
jgi:hypothetical protein